MNEFKGTKGEWTVSPELHHYNGTLAREINFGTDGECVAECVYTDYDAYLIAAAPELLEACQEAMKELEFHNWHNTSAGFKIQQAINKALNIQPA